MLNGLVLYFQYIQLNFKIHLQYKGWPMQVLSVFLTAVSDPLAVFVLFSRFGNIGSWTVERIILVYAMAVTSFGLAETFARGYDYFPSKIKTGDFDRVLLRPRSLFVQIIGSYFHIHRLSRVFTGLGMIVWSLAAQGLVLDVTTIFMLLFALAGGFLLYTGVFVFTSGLAFYTIEGMDWIYIFTNCSYLINRCPQEYLPVAIRTVFTFFMPLIVISYYPASAACGWGEAAWKGWLALPAGALFLLFAIGVWRVGVRHYKSTGS